MPRAAGSSTAFSRADTMKPCPIGESGACCRICSMGPCRLVGKDAEEKTGICGADMGTIAARHFARQVAGGVGRPLRPRPRHGDDAARRRQGRGRGLQDQGRAEAAHGGRLPGHPDRAAARSTRSPSTSPTSRSTQFGQPHGEHHLHQARDPEAPGKLGASWASPRAPSTARSSRSCTARTRASTRTPRTSSSQRAALLAGRRLGRLDAEHRHQRHPLRHAVAARQRGQPRRAQGRPGQRHRPRPRADAVGDARRGRRATRSSSP